MPYAHDAAEIIINNNIPLYTVLYYTCIVTRYALIYNTMKTTTTTTTLRYDLNVVIYYNINNILYAFSYFYNVILRLVVKVDGYPTRGIPLYEYVVFLFDLSAAYAALRIIAYIIVVVNFEKTIVNRKTLITWRIGTYKKKKSAIN